MVHPAEVDDLVVDDLDHVERFAGRHRVDEDVSMDAYGMLGIQDCVFVLSETGFSLGGWLLIVRTAYLASGIYDVTIIVYAVEVDGFRERALDSGIVGLDKVVLDELNHERRLAWRTQEARGRELSVRQAAGRADYIPTERDPRTAIFRFLSSSPGMTGR